MSWQTRYYPPITAATHRFNAFLYRLTRQDRALLQRFVAEREAALADSPLTPEERAAVAAIDLPRMAALGAHPFLARNLASAVHRLEHADQYEEY